MDSKRLIALNRRANLLRDQGELQQEEPLRRETLAWIRSPGATLGAHLEWVVVDLAENLYRQNKYAEAEPLYREIVALRQARHTKDDPQEGLATAKASLARLLTDWVWSERDSESAGHTKALCTDRSKEAENLLRYCLTIQRGGGDAVWRKADLQSRLGSALLAVVVADPALTGEDRHTKLTEAESLLLQGRESLQKARKVAIKYQRDALTRLVRLYEAWQKPDQAAEWRQKLKELR